MGWMNSELIATNQGEEELARVAAVIQKIDALQSEKNRCENCMSRLKSVYAKIAEQNESLNVAMNRSLQDELTANIVVHNIFEGNGAESIKLSVENSREKMSMYINEISNTMEMIAFQISKLQNRIYALESDICGLRATI